MNRVSDSESPAIENESPAGGPDAAAASRPGPGRRLAHALAVLGQIVYWTLTFQLVRGLRRRKYTRLIRRSHLFVTAYYLGQCPGDPSARRDPIGHYLARGAAAGLDPNPFFNNWFYLEQNPDVRGKNPLVHYLRYGAFQDRAPGPSFDSAYYVTRYPDVRESGLYPLAHYLERGHSEGRAGVPPGPPTMEPDLLEWAARSDRAEAQRVLVIDYRMLTPDHDAGSVRMLTIIRILRDLGIPVTFGTLVIARDPEYLRGRKVLAELGVEIVEGPEAVSEHLITSGGLYGTALLSRPDVARYYLPLVRGHAPWAKIVYDTVDLHWVRLLRTAEVTGAPQMREAANRVRTLELLDTTLADVTLAVTPEEQRILHQAVPGARVEVLPTIHACSPEVVPWEQRQGIMFIGGYEHTPNADAVEWFVAEILPLVARAIPGIVFHVVGSKPPERIRKLAGPGVNVTGFVEDPAPLFRSCRVFVAPLRFGAGMKGKIGQSLGYGLPVVTTSVGAEGFGLEHEVSALIADDPAAFAEAVIRLHGDEHLWSRVSDASRALLQKRFSVDALREQVRRLLDPVAGRDTPPAIAMRVAP